MRLPLPAALIGCATVILALGGCGTAANSSVNETTGGTRPPSNTSSNRTTVSSATGQSSSTAPASNTQSESSSGNSASGAGSQQPASSSPHSTPGTQSSQPPTRVASLENFTAVAGASTASHVVAKFAPTAWHNLGQAALLVTPPNSYGLNGSLLYVIRDALHSTTGKATATLLDQHAISATFSPDGKWLAVEAQTNLGTTDQPNLVTHLWMMSVDGKARYDLGPVPYVEGTWTGPNTFVYTDGTSDVYQVTPGERPAVMPLHLKSGVTVNALRANPKTGLIAIDEVVPAADNNVVDRHDVIALWNVHTGQVQSLITAPTSDGFLLGPWTQDGTRLFYWEDPEHSGSIAADGLELRTVSAKGQTARVAVTLTGLDSIAPLQTNQAVVQVGGSRYLFDKKTIQLWNGQELRPLSTAAPKSSLTEVWPTVNPGKTLVAYSQGPVLSINASQTQTSQWWQQLELVTVNLETGAQKVLANAGHGVVDPEFMGDGKHIAFVDGGELDVVSADGSGHKETVFQVSPTGPNSYPQWPTSLPVQIVDYQP